MSGSTPTTSGNQRAHAPRNDSETSCETLDKMATHAPAGLATIPAEIVLNILGHLKKKRDWLGLARTCRRVSGFVVAELDKYNVEDGQYYALWYACVTSKPTILLRQIAQDAAVVNRCFTKEFRRERVKRVKLHSKWRFYPDNNVFGKGMTPLAVAIVAGSDAIIQLLLANGADPNRPDLSPAFSNWVPWHPIHWAVASKHESSVATIKMLAEYSADMNQAPQGFIDGVSEYPKGMRCAPIFSLLMLQKPLWDSRGKRQTSCEEFNHDLRQLQGLRLRQLEALLQCGADPNVRYDWDFVTPVFFLLSNLATYNPSFYFEKSVTLSHEEDAQANVVNEIATLFLDMLRDFGADIHGLGNTYFYRNTWLRKIATEYRETPLHAACRLKDRHKPIIDWFLRNGLSIDSLGTAQGTPLMAYCDSTFTDVDLFRRFLRNGPSINHSDILGRTALHHLCANEGLRPQVREMAVKMLLDRHADPTFINNEGHAPAHELDSSEKLKSAHEDVLVMLEMAAKAWNKRARKREEHESKRNKCPASARSKAQDDRAYNQHRGRGYQGAGHGNDRRKNREDGYENKQTGHGAGNPVSSRGGNHAAAQGSNRGNRDNHQDSNRDSTPHNKGNNSNSQGKDGQGISHQRHDKGTLAEIDQSASRGLFYRKVRGGRYYSDSLGSHVDGHLKKTEALIKESVESRREETSIGSLSQKGR
ncbi:hypothetical protein F4859DRAFT_519294 [Xylaria cf. heliscus]|nr:hypothetical protein F4859DRAFT_519294 [Xylaria cf. heliscus]